MPGIEVIDGDPIELGAEILLHLAHEVADERLEIGETGAVLGRDDEAELMRIALRALEKGLEIGVVGRRVVEPSRQTLSGDAVALDVAQVRLGGPEIAWPLARCSGP